MEIVLSSSGDVQVSRKLLRFGERGMNAVPAFERIVDDLLELEREQFDSEGGRASGGWAPLAESTLESKIGPSILVETGELKASLTQRGAANQELVISPQLLVFGSNVEYATFHQHGTSRMPARKPLELTEADRQHAVRTLQRWITTGEILP